MGHSYWSFCSGSRCFGFAVSNSLAANVGRLLQGAGSAFAFTGAVYLATHGFSARRLATAIGVTAMFWHVRRLGRAICCRADDSSRSAMANDLECPGRGKSTHWLIALYRNSCWQAARVTAIPSAQFITSALRDRLQQPAIILMWTCGRSSFRAYNRWRDDLGSGLLSEGSGL